MEEVQETQLSLDKMNAGEVVTEVVKPALNKIVEECVMPAVLNVNDWEGVAKDIVEAKLKLHGNDAVKIVHDLTASLGFMERQRKSTVGHKFEKLLKATDLREPLLMEEDKLDAIKSEADSATVTYKKEILAIKAILKKLG